MSGKPFPKSKQLDRPRGGKRRPRFKANHAQWQVLAATKNGPCRACLDSASNGRVYSHAELHHVIPRSRGGDDYAENLVPLCPGCHAMIHLLDPLPVRAFLCSLTDAEYAYAVGKAGEGFAERIYGIEYQR